MRNIFMRWIWRLYLRQGSARVIFALTVTFLVSFLFLHKQDTDRNTGGVDLIQVDQSPPKAIDGQVLEIKDIQPEATPDVTAVNNDPIGEPLSDWLTVEHSNRELFVYSAYLDRRHGFHHVRVVAIIKKKKKVTQCEVSIGNHTHTVPAKSKVIREGWNLLYSAAFVLCDIPDNMRIPEKVALVHGGKADKSSAVPVQVMTERAYHGNMSVCVKAFHYEFNRAVWLVEFMEFYRLLGATHFIYYNHTVGPDVQKVLEYYVKEGVATVLPWSLPVKSQKEIRTEGIFAALNDCSLRSVGRFDYTALVDIDEFLIPREHPGLIELMSALGNYNTYIFQNVFFYLYWENDTAVHDTLFGDGPDTALGVELFGEESKTPYLLTAFKTRRLTKAHKPGARSKYIVKPENVVEVGNHNVWEHIPGTKKVINVPQGKGLSHHYRICEFGGFDCLKAPNEIDRAAHKWIVPLMRRVAERCKTMFPNLLRCPVAPPLGSPW